MTMFCRRTIAGVYTACRHAASARAAIHATASAIHATSPARAAIHTTTPAMASIPPPASVTPPSMEESDVKGVEKVAENGKVEESLSEVVELEFQKPDVELEELDLTGLNVEDWEVEDLEDLYEELEDLDEELDQVMSRVTNGKKRSKPVLVNESFDNAFMATLALMLARDGYATTKQLMQAAIKYFRRRSAARGRSEGKSDQSEVSKSVK